MLARKVRGGTREWELMSTDNHFDFSGKVCVVTGAGGGIGRGVAEAFGRAGGRVAALDRDAAGIAETVETIAAAGGEAIEIVCDVADGGSVEAAAREASSRLGAADVLVNNAGIMRHGRLEELSTDEWDLVMGINVRGYLNCAQAFGRSMLERGAGAIVHTASIAASEPHQFCGAYSPSKAAVVALSEQLTLEWGPRGVRSNCVSPGLVRTPLTEEFYAQPGVTEARREAVPLREIGAPDDIAHAVLFLASDLARYICGANLVVDGGLSHTSVQRLPRPMPAGRD